MIRLQHLLVACIALTACNKTSPSSSTDEQAPPKADGADPMADAGSPPGTGTPGSTGSTASTGIPDDPTTVGGTASGMPSAPLTDAQIVHILTTANTAEVESSSVALTKSTNAAVRAFATRMVADHTAANGETEALVARLTLTPEDNETSDLLEEAHKDDAARVAGLEGAAFDEAWVDAAVDMHTEVLDTIDRLLLPSAQNAELRVLVTEVRPMISAHLDHAKKLQATLSTSTL